MVGNYTATITATIAKLRSQITYKNDKVSTQTF